jgi:hypothetical protein
MLSSCNATPLRELFQAARFRAVYAQIVLRCKRLHTCDEWFLRVAVRQSPCTNLSTYFAPPHATVPYPNGWHVLVQSG